MSAVDRPLRPLDTREGWPCGRGNCTHWNLVEKKDTPALAPLLEKTGGVFWCAMLSGGDCKKAAMISGDAIDVLHLERDPPLEELWLQCMVCRKKRFIEKPDGLERGHFRCSDLQKVTCETPQVISDEKICFILRGDGFSQRTPATKKLPPDEEGYYLTNGMGKYNRLLSRYISAAYGNYEMSGGERRAAIRDLDYMFENELHLETKEAKIAWLEEKVTELEGSMQRRLELDPSQLPLKKRLLRDSLGSGSGGGVSRG